MWSSCLPLPMCQWDLVALEPHLHERLSKGWCSLLWDVGLVASCYILYANDPRLPFQSHMHENTLVSQRALLAPPHPLPQTKNSSCPSIVCDRDVLPIANLLIGKMLMKLALGQGAWLALATWIHVDSSLYVVHNKERDKQKQSHMACFHVVTISATIHTYLTYVYTFLSIYIYISIYIYMSLCTDGARTIHVHIVMYTQTNRHSNTWALVVAQEWDLVVEWPSFRGQAWPNNQEWPGEVAWLCSLSACGV